MKTHEAEDKSRKVES